MDLGPVKGTVGDLDFDEMTLFFQMQTKGISFIEYTFIFQNNGAAAVIFYSIVFQMRGPSHCPDRQIIKKRKKLKSRKAWLP